MFVVVDLPVCMFVCCCCCCCCRFVCLFVVVVVVVVAVVVVVVVCCCFGFCCWRCLLFAVWWLLVDGCFSFVACCAGFVWSLGFVLAVLFACDYFACVVRVLRVVLLFLAVCSVFR